MKTRLDYFFWRAYCLLQLYHYGSFFSPDLHTAALLSFIGLIHTCNNKLTALWRFIDDAALTASCTEIIHDRTLQLANILGCIVFAASKFLQGFVSGSMPNHASSYACPSDLMDASQHYVLKDIQLNKCSAKQEATCMCEMLTNLSVGWIELVND